MSGRSRRRAANRSGRRGLSLLETMLAIAILGGTLAALGELVAIGTRASEGCQETSLAQMLCENLINEVVVGLRPPAASSGTFPEYPDWQYDVGVTIVDETAGVLAIIATVGHESQAATAFTYQLIRWTIDLALKYPPEEELLEEEMTDVE